MSLSNEQIVDAIAANDGEALAIDATDRPVTRPEDGHTD